MVSDYILFASLWQFSLEICFSSQDCPPIPGNLELDQKYDIISNNASSVLGPKIRRVKMSTICKPSYFLRRGIKAKSFSRLFCFWDSSSIWIILWRNRLAQATWFRLAADLRFPAAPPKPNCIPRTSSMISMSWINLNIQNGPGPEKTEPKCCIQ